jgi:glutamine phosphoribosylpyrophosphate amidotransferase
MCGIVGAYLEGPTQQQIDTLKRLFVESKVRGRHATGYSTFQGSQLITRVAPVSAEVFVESYFAEVQPGDHKLQLIGHTRYSTSDLRYNQPIHIFHDFAIAHNGVIDQRPPSYWEEYGYKLSTTNDSELLYHCAHAGKKPLEEFPEASMAVCELRVQEGIAWYRNGKRPLYHAKVHNGWFICSTADIALRAGLAGAERCKPGVVYTPTTHTKIVKTPELITC